MGKKWGYEQIAIRWVMLMSSIYRRDAVSDGVSCVVGGCMSGLVSLCSVYFLF